MDRHAVEILLRRDARVRKGLAACLLCAGVLAAMILVLAFLAYRNHALERRGEREGSRVETLKERHDFSAFMAERQTALVDAERRLISFDSQISLVDFLHGAVKRRKLNVINEGYERPEAVAHYAGFQAALTVSGRYFDLKDFLVDLNMSNVVVRHMSMAVADDGLVVATLIIQAFGKASY